MSWFRPIALKLTPLLDLLLIVIFAQSIDLQQVVWREQDKALALQHDAQQSRAMAFDRLEQVGTLLRQRELELQQTEQRLANLERELGRRLGDVKLAREEVKQIAKLFREVVRAEIPDIQRMLEKTPVDDARLLKNELQTLRDRSAEGLVTHLRKTRELQKRSEFWEVHIDKDNAVRFRLSEDMIQPRFLCRGRDELAQRLTRFVNQLRPDPKSLVIVLFTYEDCTLMMRDEVRSGLEMVKTAFESDPNKRGKYFAIAEIGLTDSAP